MRWSILISILFPLISYAQNQTVVDSVVVITTSGATIRYTTTSQISTYQSGDSLNGRSTTTKKRIMVSPADLPISNEAQNALNTKLATNGDGSLLTGITKTTIGLPNVDNTSDANKPVSSASQTALNLKANIASPTFTGTVSGVTATMVGLGNVNNTSDAGKPVSTAQQTALDLKANLASPTFTGTVGGVTASMVGLGSVNNTSDAAKPVSTAQQTALDLKANLASPTFTGTVAGITATMVGLGSVNNTSDAAKPVSTAQQTALDLKSNIASPTFTGTVTLPASTSFTTPVIGAATGTSLALTGAITSSGGGIGYATGNGGAVTQATNKSTGVTLNKVTGEITLNNAALAAATIVSFTLTNSTIAATDQVLVQHQATGTFGAYTINARAANGSAIFSIRNNTAGSLGEAIVIRYTVIKSVSN